MSIGDLLALIHDSDDSWHTVAGVVHEWRDQRLVHKAFMPKVSAEGGSTFSFGASSKPEVFESDYKLWADRDRVRVERGPSHEARPELLVRVGAEWWTFGTHGGAVTNGGRDNRSTGGDEVMCQLRPAQYLSLFRWSLTGETEVASRPALVARAERRGTDEGLRMFVPTPFEMIAGGTQFEVCVDADRGVLLRVLKLVDGEAAELREFREATFDGPVDDAMFNFVAPDGSAVQDFESYVARLRSG